MTTTLALLAGITALAYAVQTVTGFGAVLVSVTIGAHLLPIPELLLYLLPLSLLQCTYITIRHRAAIEWRLLLRWIIPLMGAGTIVGAAAASSISGPMLKRILAVLILGLSLFELYRLWSPEKSNAVLSTPTTVLGLVGAGLMHGVYATGGPLLVYTIGRRVTDKSVFRSTLTIVWALLNTGLVGYFIATGRYHSQHPGEIAMLVPGVILAVVVGERLHASLDGHRFRQIIFGLLACAAVALFLGTL